MCSIIKNNLILYLNDKRKILVFIVFSFFGGMCMDTAMEAKMSLMEYVLFLMTDHYYLVYFLFLAYLFFSIDSMKEESELLYIRLNTIKKQYVCRMISVLLQSVVYVGCHLLVAFLIGSIKLKCTNVFMASSIDGYYNDTLVFLMEYKKYFLNPSEAFVVTSLYMILGLTFFSMIVYVVKEVFGKKITIIVIGFIIINLMIGFKCNFSGVTGFFFLNHYFILHHSLFSDGVRFVLINIIIMCLLLWCGYRILKYKKGNKLKKRKDSILNDMQSGVVAFSSIFLVTYVLLSCMIVVQKEDVISRSDLIFSILLGYSSKSFHLTEFMQYVLFFGIPIFFVGTIFEQEKKMYNQQIAIRYGSRAKWEKQLKRSIEKYVAKYFLIYFFSLIGLTMIGYPFFQAGISEYEMDFIQYTEIPQREFCALLFMAIVIKAIELIYYTNLFELLEQLLNNRITSFLLMFAGFIVGIIFPDSIFISYGTSSLYNLANRVSVRDFSSVVVEVVGVLLVKIFVLKVISVMFRKAKGYK